VSDQLQSKWGGWRRGVVIAGFAALAVSLLCRAAYLQVFEYEYFRSQGADRQLRTVDIAAHRGDLLDRRGEPLAISTPIDTLWAVPSQLAGQPDKLVAMARILGIDPQSLNRRVLDARERNHEFMYVQRHVLPGLVAQVKALDIEGLNVLREYRRYYPSGSAASHIVGFTGIDDDGREGLVSLSIDRQLQYFADKALREAIEKHDAESGSVVVMDTRSGEVLGMVNFPSYNPNNINDRSGGQQRNRALTDVFEPGSTMKPFTVAAALESGDFNEESKVYTSPGRYRIGRHEISDFKDYGWLDLNGVVTKSSNVGISMIAKQLGDEQMWSVFDAFGFGHPTGYGISVTALQLTRAYAALANNGLIPTVSFVKKDESASTRRVIDESIALDIRGMLESVVLNGSGKNAVVPGYTVAGKTGTTHRSQYGGYSEDRYASLFAGFAPASDPRIAAVVIIHDPKAGQYFGGEVAAPVFAEVMSRALRQLGIEPDALDRKRAQAPLQAPLQAPSLNRVNTLSVNVEDRS